MRNSKKIPKTSFLHLSPKIYTPQQNFCIAQGVVPIPGEVQRRHRHPYSLATPSLVRSGAPGAADTYPGRGEALPARLRLPGQGPV